ncbi:biotin/lipoyl-binding protein [Halocynthiibacter sp. C4]|uniref:HlyD family secretion protein n=1 Tax=Halocynthiibacter sp. C4 TaxID=2992758 RepID=UPI00237AD71B|nr:biotin/lipoyl-binding protein [Halocynthiibacter sp. C4]MDE0591525.1 biotin/lipoyl-binding protein [Halocynthiibacter sp. C4]
MFELTLCSMFTILPDYLYRRYGQDKRIGREITLFSVWYELRWGITLCFILTVSLITAIFYFHPSTKAANSVYRTVTILPEINGRVEETYVAINEKVSEGDPIFKLDDSKQRASVEMAKRKIEEIDARMIVAQSQLKEAEGRVIQAQGVLEQAIDEYEVRAELLESNSGAVSERDVERLKVRVDTEQGSVDAATAHKEAIESQIEFQLPAEKASAVASLDQAMVELDKTLVTASTDGIVQQFALRPGDVVNPMLRPAGILVPERLETGLVAGFGQIQSKVLKVGMIGEVTCMARPWEIIPVVVAEVQNVIAAGQIRPTDTLVDVSKIAPDGTITVILEPLIEGSFEGLPQGAACIANVYSSGHEMLARDDLTTLQKIGYHGMDTVGLVHALILRIQALLLPVQTLVLKGH